MKRRKIHTLRKSLYIPTSLSDEYCCLILIGKPASHAQAQQLVAGFAAAEADKFFDNMGLNFLDRARAKLHTQHEAESALENGVAFF